MNGIDTLTKEQTDGQTDKSLQIEIRYLEIQTEEQMDKQTD